VNGRNVAVKTNSFQPGSSPRTGRTSAVWTYRGHVGNYPGNQDAIPAYTTSDVVVAGLPGEVCTTSCYSRLSADIAKTVHLLNALLRLGKQPKRCKPETSARSTS
jgi:hypothetical protein